MSDTDLQRMTALAEERQNKLDAALLQIEGLKKDAATAYQDSLEIDFEHNEQIKREQAERIKAELERDNALRLVDELKKFVESVGCDSNCSNPYGPQSGHFPHCAVRRGARILNTTLKRICVHDWAYDMEQEATICKKCGDGSDGSKDE